MATRVNAINSLIGQKTIDDEHPRQVQLERLHPGRLEHKASLVPEFAHLPRL
jgi:hypothetical protein